MFFSTQNRFIASIFLALAIISTFFINSFENYQFYVLPVILLGVLALLNTAEIRILVFCLFIWLVIEISVFPIRFFNLDYSNFVLSQLNNDKNGLVLRSLKNRINNNKTQAIYYNQTVSKNITNWLSVRPNTSFVVTGSVDLLKIIFQEKPKLLSFISKEIENSKIEKDFLILDSKYALALTPLELEIPREPEDLTSGLLEEMSVALAPITNNDIIEELKTREKAASKARSLYGYWKSGTGRSWAFFTEATLELIRVFKTNDTKSCEDIKKKFAAASSLLHSKKKPPAFISYVYNNSAVSEIICRKDYENAKKLTQKAHTLAADLKSKELVQINFDYLRNF